MWGVPLVLAAAAGMATPADPPSSALELDLAGLEGVGALHLTAAVQRRVETESLCTVKVPLRRGESEEAVLARARDAIAASQACAARKVRAVLDPGHAGQSEDEFARAPRLRLEAPGVGGNQLITAVRVAPGAATGACVRLAALGVPVLDQLQRLRIDLLAPPEGAAGGSLRLIELTPLGTCALTVRTAPGQSGADIAAVVARAVHTPGTHPDCPAERNARDIKDQGGALVMIHASALELCSMDRKVGFDLRPAGLAHRAAATD